MSAKRQPTIIRIGIPLTDSGQYILRNNDTLCLDRQFITVYATAVEVYGQLLSREEFDCKYTALELIYGQSSEPDHGHPPHDEDME